MAKNKKIDKSEGKIDSMIDSIIKEKYPNLAEEWVDDIKKILFQKKILPAIKEFLQENSDTETVLLTISRAVEEEIQKKLE